MIPPSIQPLSWDSAQLGVSCGLLDLCDSALNLGEISASACLQAIDQASEDFLTVKLPASGNRLAQDILRRSCSFLDVELTFSHRGMAPPPPSFCPVDVQFCRLWHGDEFRALAKDMLHSRLIKDFHIPRAAATALWENSIINHCRGRADELAVAFKDGIPAGLVTINQTAGNRTSLHIVGVLAKFRGCGVGRTLMEAVVARCAGKSEIVVETQPSNAASIRLYQAAGFRYTSAKYVLHFWKKALPGTTKTSMTPLPARASQPFE